MLTLSFLWWGQILNHNSAMLQAIPDSAHEFSLATHYGLCLVLEIKPGSVIHLLVHKILHCSHLVLCKMFNSYVPTLI